MKKYLLAIILFAFTALSYAQEKPYVLLVSFDAFRWDYLNRGITPNLEKVKEAGASALSFQPSFPSKTFPNHYSIITGMYPAHHGIIGNSITDPFTKGAYKMSDSNAVRDAWWYQGEAFWETAERQGIVSASYFWPGSEVLLKYRHPTYYTQFEHSKPDEERVEGVINWLQLPAEKRPHFITLYFSETDDQGHKFGPNSDQVNDAVKRLDGITGYLFGKLESIKMRDSVDVIIVSDHGMTEVSDSNSVDIEKILAGVKCRLSDAGPQMFVTPPAGKEKAAYELLKKSELHYKVYYRDEVPEYFHFNDHPFIAPIVVVADMGWSAVTSRKSGWTSKGNHGYDNHQLDMHGIFLAEGPHIKQNYRTGTLLNIDVYPLLCRIFKIYPRPNIDGKAERIDFILKGE